MPNQLISISDFRHITKLAHLTVEESKESVFVPQLEGILEYFDILNKVDTTGVEPTYQVTGQKSVLRPDVIDTNRMFTQAQALANAKQQHDGYFVTKATISKK